MSARIGMNGDAVEEREDGGFGPVLQGAATGGSDRDGDGDGFGPALRGSAPSPEGAPPEEGYGPVQRGRRLGLRRATRQLARTALAGLLIVVLLVVGLGGALLVTTMASLRQEPVGGLSGAGGQMNVLVVGSDSREGLTPQQLQALGTEAVEGQRTDTIFVLSVRGGAAAMLSLPRDLFVTRCDGTRGRVNSAFAMGGPTCLVETVTTATGIPLTHYAEINLGGLVRIVDAVGGVTLHLEAPLHDVAAGVDLPAGCVHLDGAEAVGFVRARTVDSDLGRIARQQRFLAQLASEVLDADTLLNPPRLFRLARAAARSLTVDDDLGILDLARLARAARGLAGGGLATYTVPAASQTIGGAAVLVPTEEAAPLYERFTSGAVLDLPSSAPGAALAPADVQLVVRNGTRTRGLASAVADDLERRGFAVTEVGNAERVDRTVVRHPAPLSAAAQVVAAAMSGAATVVDDSLATIELVLGPEAVDAAGTAGAAGAGGTAPQHGDDVGADAGAGQAPRGAGAVPADC